METTELKYETIRSIIIDSTVKLVKTSIKRNPILEIKRAATRDGVGPAFRKLIPFTFLWKGVTTGLFNDIRKYKCGEASSCYFMKAIN
jgi:hypothetical protein